MRIYQLDITQNLPIGIDEAWDFFSNPKNLAEITPNDLDFNILMGADEKMFQGQIIHYKLKPLLSIPVRWTTEICHVEHKKYFVDQQLFGPYALWHHKHFFKEIDGGIQMRDLLHYAMPLGVVGRAMNSIFIAKKVKSIFDYRFKVLEERFGKM